MGGDVVRGLPHGPSTMGNNLKQLRQRRGWTMELAAHAMGQSTKGYEKIERGERRLTADRITRAAEVYQVPEVDVIGSRSRSASWARSSAAVWLPTFQVAPKIFKRHLARGRNVIYDVS